MSQPQITRRPLSSRDTKWAAASARWLARNGFRPNQISLLSVGFAGLAGAAFVSAGYFNVSWQPLFFVAAAVFMQLRLLCNLFDGMVAIEGGFKTKSGELYNELPDRFADAIILGCAGYAVPTTEWFHALGWLAAVLALITAYVRALGASAGASQCFTGPMAKPHRMAVMTICAVLMAGLGIFGKPFNLIHPALAIICLGCLATIVRRVARIARELESK